MSRQQLYTAPSARTTRRGLRREPPRYHEAWVQDKVGQALAEAGHRVLLGPVSLRKLSLTRNFDYLRHHQLD